MSRRHILIFVTLGLLLLAISAAIYFIDITVTVVREGTLVKSENPAYLAISDGLPAEDIEKLLKSNPDYIYYTFSSFSLMSNAIREGREDVVQLLIENGFPPNGIPGYAPPLRSAMHYDEFQIAKYLIDEGSDPFSGNPSPMEMAEFTENEKYIELFRTRGSEAQGQTRQTDTPD